MAKNLPMPTGKKPIEQSAENLTDHAIFSLNSSQRQYEDYSTNNGNDRRSDRVLTTNQKKTSNGMSKVLI